MLWEGRQIFNELIIMLILLVFISRVVTLIRRYINKVSPNKYKNGIMVLLLWYVDIAFGSYPPPPHPPPWASFMSWAPPCIITTNSLFRLPVSLSSMWWSHQNRLLFFPRSYSCHTFRNKDLMYSTDIECARGCENRKNDVIRRRMPIQNVKRSGIVCCYARH